MQTLEHRRLRNRDAQTDSAFTTMVLNIEQRKLDSQAWKAQVILPRGKENHLFGVSARDGMSGGKRP